MFWFRVTQSMKSLANQTLQRPCSYLFTHSSFEKFMQKIFRQSFLDSGDVGQNRTIWASQSVTKSADKSCFFLNNSEKSAGIVFEERCRLSSITKGCLQQSRTCAPQEGCDPLFEKCWLKHTAKICMEEVFRFKMMSCRIVIAIAPTLNKLFMQNIFHE